MVWIDPGKYGYYAAILADDTQGRQELHLAEFSSRSKEFQLPSNILYRTNLAVHEGLLYAVQALFPGEEIVVFCEEPVSAGARNLRTYGQMAMSVGAIVAALTQHTPRVYLVPVSKWKEVVVGKGNASKAEVALWLNRVHPIYAAQCDGRQDLIDACCIALYGLTLISTSLLVSNWDGPGEAV